MRHHDETLDGYLDSVSERPEVLGVVLIGSVARGTPREDSDVDVYLVVTDEAYAEAEAQGRIAAVSHDGVTYPGGYVDIKLASPSYLRAAAEHADDPTRASFTGCRVALDRPGQISTWIEGIVTLPEEQWARRITSYRAQAQLYGGYFLPQADQLDDQFLRQHSSVHLATATGRIALAQHHQFFRGQKYLTAAMAELDLPAEMVSAWHHLVAVPGAPAGHRLLAALTAWLGPSEPFAAQLSRFIGDNELAWLNGTVPPEFW